MRFLALAAAASLTLAPTLPLAQQGVCPQNAIQRGNTCFCAPGFLLSDTGACVVSGPDVKLAVQPGGSAGRPLPILSTIPADAIIVGSLVILGGMIIGIAATSGGTPTTTTGTTP